METTIEDLVSILLGGGTITTCYREYHLKSVVEIDDHTGKGWKAVISTGSFNYRCIDFADSKEDAVLLTLKTLHSMGKLGEYKSRSPESSKSSKKKSVKDPKQPTAIKSHPVTEPSPIPSDDGCELDDMAQPVVNEPELKRSPQEIEKRTILGIVTRNHQK